MSPWEVWEIIYRGANPPKRKFFVVAHIPTEVNYVLGFFISTEPRRMLMTPENQVCMVGISQATHTFLQYDSILAVNQLITVFLVDFVGQLGQLDESALADTRRAVELCPALGRKSKSLIL